MRNLNFPLLTLLRLLLAGNKFDRLFSGFAVSRSPNPGGLFYLKGAVMANVFEKATKLAGTALELLKRDVKLPSIFVHKYGIADFKGAAGDVVNVKRPPLLRARDKGWRSANAIQVDDLTQSKIQVKLDMFPYSAVHLSPEEATLDEVEFVRDIQAPQLSAMAEFYEEAIVDALAAADFVYEVNFNTGGSGYAADASTVALRARKHMNDARVPLDGRYWLVGSSVSEAIAGNSKLQAVDTSGSPEALRDGIVGRLSGFTVIEVPALAPTESYFVHESAVALANVAPVVPAGATAGSSIQGNGIAVTQIFDYDSANAKDRSIVESFVGASLVLDPETDTDGKIRLDGNGDPYMEFFRAVKVNYGATSKKAVWTLTYTGTVSGGTFDLTVDGETAADIAYGATNAQIATALNGLDGVEGVTVTGTTAKTITFTSEVLFSAEDAYITGGGTIVAS